MHSRSESIGLMQGVNHTVIYKDKETWISSHVWREAQRLQEDHDIC